MTNALDPGELDARALAARREVLHKLALADGRPTSELRSLNPLAPRLAGLAIKIDERGRWRVYSETSAAEGFGLISLIATLADVPLPAAAAFLQRLLPSEPRT